MGEQRLEDASMYRVGPRRAIMVHKPEKGQEDKLVVQEVDPQKDIKNTRENLVPNTRGDGASLEHEEESLVPPNES
jgi:hypothetical protein